MSERAKILINLAKFKAGYYNFRSSRKFESVENDADSVVSSSTDTSQIQPRNSYGMKSDSDSEHKVKESSILLQSDEFDSDPSYSPSFLSSTDSDMNFEESNDENNDQNNERASPIISYISDLCFPDSWTSEAVSMSNTKK